MIRSLASRLVALEPVDSDEARDFVYRVYSDDESGLSFRYGGLPPPRDVFEADVLAGAFDHSVARLTVGRRDLVGYARCDDADLVAGHAVVSVGLVGRFQRRGLVFLVGSRYLDELFRRYPFRKLYFHVPAHNAPRFTTPSAARLDVEAVLRDHVFFAGGYWDMFVASMSRASWELHKTVGLGPS